MLRRLWAAKSLANRKAKGVSPVICPNEHGTMEIVRLAAENTFRGMVIRYDTEFWACDVCGLEVEDLRLAAENQRALSDAYRIAADLLTGGEIVEERKRLGWSQDKLARVVNVGVASVKRWERGQVQTPVWTGRFDRYLMACRTTAISRRETDCFLWDGSNWCSRALESY